MREPASREAWDRAAFIRYAWNVDNPEVSMGLRLHHTVSFARALFELVTMKGSSTLQTRRGYIMYSIYF